VARHAQSASGERGQNEAGLSAEASAKAQAGMTEMSKRFHDQGGEIYVPAD
jgi:hypothetical protein